jgi:hypothetical protein
MNCPPDVADVVLEILSLGILQARAWAFQSDSRRCAHETDHIHNLPDLLKNYKPELLAYYWNSERPAHIRRVSEENCRGFLPAWERLRPLVERECGVLASNNPAAIPGVVPNQPADMIATG